MRHEIFPEPMTEARSRSKYRAPIAVTQATLSGVLEHLGRPPLEPKQMSFIQSGQSKYDSRLFYAGDLEVLRHPSLAIVGARDVSEEGAARARRLARGVAAHGVTVVSGLAKGVDFNAHTAAIEQRGHTVAVIGTPLSKAYPASHGELQQEIADRHLLVSPFEEGSRVFPSNFPKRNRVMAALTDGTVIVEAGDSSGTLHQAVECQRLGRWLFIVRSVYDNPDLAWPRKFNDYSKLCVVDRIEDVLDRVVR